MDISSVLDSLLAGAARHKAAGYAGKVKDVAGQVFGQATEGVGDAFRKVDDLTGASDRIDAVVGTASGGQTTGDLLDRAKGIAANNKVATGAVLGGLGLLLLGTKRGRKVTAGAAKVGGLALIGGLAYKAYRNIQEGKSWLGQDKDGDAVAEAPEGSGFEAANQNAHLYVRAMIAAAAADGQVSPEERRLIASGLADSGVASDVLEFLDREFESPASCEDLAAAADTPEVATQVYTAARLAIEPDTEPERAFLGRLADALGLARDLVEQLDQSAAQAKA